MSQVKWCDLGQHVFPANQPGSTTLKFERYVKNQWGGAQPSDIVQDVCAACAKDAGVQDYDKVADLTEDEEYAKADAIRQGKRFNPFTKQKKAAAIGTRADQAKEKGYDPDYVKWLEDQANKT